MSTKGYFRVAIYSRDCPLQTAAALVHYQHILMATAATHIPRILAVLLPCLLNVILIRGK